MASSGTELKFTLEDVLAALEYASEGRPNSVKPDLLGNHLNRIIGSRIGDLTRLARAQVVKDLAGVYCWMCKQDAYVSPDSRVSTGWSHKDGSSCNAGPIHQYALPTPSGKDVLAEQWHDRDDRLAATVNSIQEDYLRLYAKFHKLQSDRTEHDRQVRLDAKQEVANALIDSEIQSWKDAGRYLNKRLAELRAGKEPGIGYGHSKSQDKRLRLQGKPEPSGDPSPEQEPKL